MTTNSEVDFNDVFGGPPRRSSIHEMRYSLGDRRRNVEFEDGAATSSSWLGLSEKPVFGGEDSLNRRRYASDVFYDDIFRGSSDENCYSSPRRRSMPGSGVLSPAHPSPPKSELFNTSLPAQFSLPAKLTKAVDLPVFASGNRSPHRYKEGTSNMQTSNTTLSRFSSQGLQGQEDLRNNARLSSGQSELSHEFFLGSEELSYMTKSTDNEIGGNIGRENTESFGTPTRNKSQFHFSIYKWAGKGVPLLMPLRGGKSSTVKVGGTVVRSLSSKARNGSDTNVQDTNSPFLNGQLLSNNMSIEMEGEEQKKTNANNIIESSQTVEEAFLKQLELKSLQTTQTSAENFLSGTTFFPERLSGTTLSDKKGVVTYSVPETELYEGNKKEVSVVTQEAKPESRSLRSTLHDVIEGQGDEEIYRNADGKKNVETVSGVSYSNVGLVSLKKHYWKTMNTKTAEVRTAPVGSPSRQNLVKSRVNGKVKEFVKIFNQEAPPKSKVNVSTQSQSSGRKVASANGADSEVTATAIRLDNKMPLPKANMKPDASFKGEESTERPYKQQSAQSHIIHKNRDQFSIHMDASPFSESIPCDFEVILESTDDPFQIKELSVDEDKLSQNEEDSEALQAAHSKIQLWSNGKKGNIRSLLSTLQYVLWPESGWKPVALVDIIEGSAVKRAYQKALLCLHPDKLQQKGVASHQKYMAEKVFDVLQEAWDHFNSLGSL